MNVEIPSWAAPYDRVLHVVLYEEARDKWVAQCLEHDINIVVGRFIGESTMKFNEAMRAVVNPKIAEGWSTRYAQGLSWIPKPDPKFQAMWDAAAKFKIPGSDRDQVWRCLLHRESYGEYLAVFAIYRGVKS